MEIRQVTAEERLTTTFPLQMYAFDGSPESPDDAEDMTRYVPYFREVVTLTAQEDGATLACAAAIPMRQNVGGLVLPMAGVASVTSDPVARRRGLVRRLMEQLLGQMRDSGHVVSALYPFRPSYYERFGYVSVSRMRTASFAPAGLGHLVKAELPGTVVWRHLRDGFDELRGFTEGLLGRRHGFSLFPLSRALMVRDTKDLWLVTARDAGGATVGAATYRIDRHGGELTAEVFLTTGPESRALLLQFFARHVDQVTRVTVPVAPDELPELWATDLAVEVLARVAYPSVAAPMVRVLDPAGLSGMAAGDGRVVVEVTGDALAGGRWELRGDGGRLAVSAGGGAVDATLTVAGFSALVFGVLDPVEVALRGLGAVPADAADVLRRMFPRRMPMLYEAF